MFFPFFLKFRPTDHIFEDKTFPIATTCAGCNKKIWMKYGRQCRDCLATIHKKCEEKFNNDTTCTHEQNVFKYNPTSSPSDDDLKNMVHIELPDNVSINSSVSSPVSIPTSIPSITTTAAATTPADDVVEGISMKSNDSTTSLPNLNRSTTANRISTKAAAAFSVLDSTARRSFRAFGHKNANHPPANISPNLSTTSDLSISDESIHNSTRKPSTTTTATTTATQVHTSSKIANAASSAYSKFREFKSKRLPITTETNPIKKAPIISETRKLSS